MAGDKAFDTTKYRKQFQDLTKKYKELYNQRMPQLENYENFVNTQLDTLIGQTAPAAQDMFRQSKQMSDQYTNEFLPATSQYLKSATGYDTPERRAEAKSKAMVDVQTGADAARKGALERLESYGIDPSQTRGAAMDQNIRLQTALDQVRSGKEAELDVEERGRAYTSEALGMGSDIQRGALATAGQASDTLARNTSLAGQNAETWANIYGTPSDNLRDQQSLARDRLSSEQWERAAKQGAKAAEKGGGFDWGGVGSAVGLAGGAIAGGAIGGPAGAALGASLGSSLGGQAGGAAGGGAGGNYGFNPNAGAGLSSSWGDSSTGGITNNSGFTYTGETPYRSPTGTGLSYR